MVTDIREGNLKAILGLFFSLSRHKQQQKSAAHQQKTQQTLRQEQRHLVTGETTTDTAHGRGGNPDDNQSRYAEWVGWRTSLLQGVQESCGP